MNPTGSTQLPSEITDAASKARALTYGASSAAAAAPSVTDELRARIQEAYSSNQDIINPLNQASQKYYQAPSEARVKYQDIFNPFQRENLVSQYTGNAALPMLNLSSMLGTRLGRISDLLGAGTNAYNATVGQQNAEAQMAQSLYSDLLQQYSLQQQAEQANRPNQQVIEANGRKYLVVTDQQGNMVSKQDMGASSTGSGGADLSGIGDILTQMLGGGNTDANTDGWEDITSNGTDSFSQGSSPENFIYGPSQTQQSSSFDWNSLLNPVNNILSGLGVGPFKLF